MKSNLTGFQYLKNDHFDNLLTVDVKEVCLILSDAQRKVYICINTGGAFLKAEITTQILTKRDFKLKRRRRNLYMHMCLCTNLSTKVLSTPVIIIPHWK